MKINGNKIAEKMQQDLALRVDKLVKNNITPKIAIVTVNEEDTWKVYVSRKTKLASSMGIRAVIYNLKDFDQPDLEKFVQNLNNNKSIHGIIVQRPLPKNFDESRVVDLINIEKDIDGFRKDSPFYPPVVEAVKIVLEKIYNKPLKKTLKNKKVVILGKGATGGGPTIEFMKSIEIQPDVIDSKTTNAKSILKNADIIISAVGKKVVEEKNIKKDSVLIGIGTHVKNGKLKGDFDQKEIEKKAKAYTPTPGGIGPLNLTCLFTNLIKAAENNQSK